MNTTHLHLMINHLPVIATPIVALLLVYGLVRRSREILRLAAGAAVVVAALTYPVFLTGEPAEERVEEAAWFPERMVHEHEERAEMALIAIMVTGLVAAVGLWQSRKGRDLPRATAGLTLLGLLVSSGLLAWTANSGGVIRHEEIRPGATAVVAEGAGGEDSTGHARLGGKANDRDDDD
jgi:formate hydrogenlyase subunit 3/multisubunit Na+/H+ antiporter MnhD subunit